MTKGYETCRDCFYGAFNKYCTEADCTCCPMYNGEDLDGEKCFCKCNEIEVGAVCEHYKPLEDE